jgi:hypothetical protein
VLLLDDEEPLGLLPDDEEFFIPLPERLLVPCSWRRTNSVLKSSSSQATPTMMKASKIAPRHEGDFIVD